MLIRFWFGALHIGRASHIGTDGAFDASITFMWGWRGLVPPNEPLWRFIWRCAWNWLPDVVYRIEPRPSPSEIAFHNLVSTISNSADRPLSLSSDKAICSEDAPTERIKVIGFGDWRHAVTVIRSNRRSKMYVYLTGAKERRNPKHIVRCCPAAVIGVDNAPSEWRNLDGTAKNFEIEFIHGRASVEEQLGAFMLKHGYAQKTNLIRRTGSTLGSLAAAIRGA